MLTCRASRPSDIVAPRPGSQWRLPLARLPPPTPAARAACPLSLGRVQAQQGWILVDFEGRQPCGRSLAARAETPSSPPEPP